MARRRPELEEPQDNAQEARGALVFATYRARLSARPGEDLQWMADASDVELREWALRVLEEPVELDPEYTDDLPRLPQPRRHAANDLLGLLDRLGDTGAGDEPMTAEQLSARTTPGIGSGL